MNLILNGINGRYLREVTANAASATDKVEAAVAYVTEESLLFKWCWEKRIPLRFWGRFDDSIPIKPEILRSFLNRRSPNFACKLLTHFHAKIIWWHGFGAYIGSANLSDAAWNSNVEAGCFFDQAEIDESPIEIQLRTFFLRIDEHASPLSDELLRAIEVRGNELKQRAQQDRTQRESFMETPGIHRWYGLLRTIGNTALHRQRDEFLDEWNGTLQDLRNIGVRVSLDENRLHGFPKTCRRAHKWINSCTHIISTMLWTETEADLRNSSSLIKITRRMR